MAKGVKTITVSLDAYEALQRLKREGESFSDVILRLARERRSLMDLAGKWRSVSDEEAEKILKSVREAWSKWSVQLAE